MPYKKDDREIKIIDFDAIQVGDQAELTHALTQEDVNSFAALTGDFNPLHVDEDFAKKTLFQKPVVHGMLSASFISTMIGMLLPGGGALWMSQSLEFLKPAYIGDTLSVVSTVKQKSVSTRILVLEIVITNQHGEELVKGESVVKILKLKDEEKKMKNDSQKIVLVTGASRGIGAATAKRLAADGHTVVVNYQRSKDKAEKVVEEITRAGGKSLAIKADVSDFKEVKAMFEKVQKALGPINAIVHCAAPQNVPQPFDKLGWNLFQEQLDIHLKGGFHCVQCALSTMTEKKCGDIIFLGTIYTDGAPPPQQSRYIAAKAALTSLARCLAVEYGPRGIKVNVVAPGMTQTDMIANLPDKVKMLTKMQTPLRRLAEPEDIAGTISFLLSSAARHMTGETIRVCGGAVME